MQVDVAFQYNRTGEPYTGGHRQLASALPGKRVDGTGKRFGTKMSPVADSSEIAQNDFVIGKRGSLYARHFERQIRIKRFVFILGRLA